MKKLMLTGLLVLVPLTLGGCVSEPPSPPRAPGPSTYQFQTANKAFGTCIMKSAYPIDNRRQSARDVAEQAMGNCFSQWWRIERLDEKGLSPFDKMRMRNHTLRNEIRDAIAYVRIQRMP